MVTGACARSTRRSDTWEVVNGEVVSTPLISAGAMTSYVEARVALEQVPPDLDAARAALGNALLSAPRDPHLWLSKAELEILAQDGRACLQAISVARKLSADSQRLAVLATRCNRLAPQPSTQPDAPSPS